jgi:hypothetical protein
MGSVRHPRGRLPQRVYWVRRGAVLAMALLLVFGIGKLLGGNGQDPAASGVEASNSSAQQEQSSSLAPTVGPVAPSISPGAQASKGPLLPPSGACKDDEVSVLPSVPRAWAAGDITIRLGLQGIQPACTFKVSPDSVVVKITSGSDRIWSSQDCPSSIKPADVVVRNGVPTYVNVVWSGRRSDDTCSRSAAFANTGYYHAFAAVLGSTPTDTQFEVTRAPTDFVTETAKPKPSQSPSQSAGQSSGQSSGRAPATTKPKATSTPSATVSGKGSKCGGDNAAGSC